MLLVGDNMDYLLILLKTLFFYFAIVLFYRFMGKREVGELGIIDLIVSILIAELAAISIEKYNTSIFFMLLPIALLVILQIVLAKVSLKSDKLRNMLITRQIYCPIHWPKDTMIAPHMEVNRIYDREISLICDQRYTPNQISGIVQTIKELK